MLVLTRKVKESIIINDQITVTVLKMHGDKISLGIEADKNIPVHRTEVAERMKAEGIKIIHRLPLESEEDLEQ